MQWSDLLTAFGLVLVLEGILPFLGPRISRRLMEEFMALNDRTVRIIGLSCMVVGLMVVYAVRW